VLSPRRRSASRCAMTSRTSDWRPDIKAHWHSRRYLSRRPMSGRALKVFPGALAADEFAREMLGHHLGALLRPSRPVKDLEQAVMDALEPH